MKKYLLVTMAILILPLSANAKCPAISVADMKGVKDGKYPQQFEKAGALRLYHPQVCLSPRITPRAQQQQRIAVGIGPLSLAVLGQHA